MSCCLVTGRWFVERAPCWRAYPGQFPDGYHPSGFTHRAKAWVYAGEPGKAFHVGFGRLLLFDKRVDSRLHLGNKLQLKVSFYGMVVNTEAPDLDKPPGQDVQGKPSQEFNPIKSDRLFDRPVNSPGKKEQCLSLIDKPQYLSELEELNAYEAWRQISGKDPFLCRKCKTGRMRLAPLNSTA